MCAAPKQTIPEISSKALEMFQFGRSVFIEEDGIRYEVRIARTPNVHDKPYHVLYMLDGDVFFPLALNMYADHVNEINQAIPILFVGIGYGGNLAYNIPWRTRNYTPYAEGEAYQEGGGAAEFLNIVHGIRTYISRTEHIDMNNEAIFGHSFGGLFALYVFFNAPKTFTHYFEASPSIWWGDGVVVPHDIQNIECNQAMLYIMLGSLEDQQRRKNPLRDKGISAQKLAEILEERNTCHTDFMLFDNKGHGDVIPDALWFTITNFTYTQQ